MGIAQQIKAFLEKYRNRVEVFGITFLAGFLVHFYMFTNKFYNYFEMNNILNPMSVYKSDTLAMGRWMAPVLSRLSTIYSMPAVNGAIGILFLAGAALLVCDILQISSRFWGSMVGILFVTFPSTASMFSYGTLADNFYGAIFLSVLGAWCLIRGKNSRGLTFVGVVVIGLAVGAYQPFFAISIALVYSVLFVEAVQKGQSFAQIVKDAIWYGILLVLGFVFYYLCLFLLLQITGVTLGDYHGVDNMTSFTPKGVAKGFVYTYLYFLRYLFTMEYANYGIHIVANVILTIGMMTLIFITYRRRESQKGNLFSIVLLILVLPVGTLAAPFLMADRVGNGVDRYMMFSIVMIYILFIKLFSEQHLKRCMMQWIGCASLLVVVFSGYYMCNQSYFRMESMTNQTDALFTRIVARMEMTEGWNSEVPVYLANCEKLFSEELAVEIPEFDRLTRMDGTELKPWYNRTAVAKYMAVYLHFPIREATEEQVAKIEQTENYQGMGIYPASDAVQMIDGVLVVKFNEEMDE